MNFQIIPEPKTEPGLPAFLRAAQLLYHIPTGAVVITQTITETLLPETRQATVVGGVPHKGAQSPAYRFGFKPGDRWTCAKPENYRLFTDKIVLQN